MGKENLQLLKYDQRWLDYKVLTLNFLQTQVNEFNTGEDENAEHYRYTTFKNYLQTKSSLSDELITKLFDLIKIDSDVSMASAMAIDILKTKTLTELQFIMVADFLKLSFGENMQKYIDREIVWRQKRQSK